MTQRDPFDDIEALLERMGREFEELGGTLDGPGPQLPPLPGTRDLPVDVVETDESISVVADLPGFDADDIGVELRDGALVITADREDAGDADRAGDRDEASNDHSETAADAISAGETGGDAGEANDDEADGVRYHRRERHTGSASRRVPLPEPVERGAATAAYDAGVLTVTLPKRSPANGGHTIDVD